MGIEKDNVTTQDQLPEAAPIDQIEPRVEAEMKKLEGKARKDVAESLGNKELSLEGEKLELEGEQDLEKAEKENG
jgi:uncharacterized protein YjbJ (UPF0337 family)